MKPQKKTALIIGILYIIATVAFSIAMVLLDSIENQNYVIIAALLVLVDAIAVAGIGIFLYKILKKYKKFLALSFTCARVLEGLFFTANAIILLFLMNSTESSKLLSAYNWTFLVGYGLIFGISALILNFVLYKSQLIPRWLSGWGFISAIFVLTNFLFLSFGITLLEFLDFSIAIQEMVFAVWLIVKGFK